METTVPHDRCPSCGHYELDAKAGEMLELRAAQVVMHEAQDLDPVALKFARKALEASGKTHAGCAKEGAKGTVVALRANPAR